MSCSQKALVRRLHKVVWLIVSAVVVIVQSALMKVANLILEVIDSGYPTEDVYKRQDR